MLDTKARRWVQPILEKTADFSINLGFTANHITILALFLGLVPALCIFLGLPKVIAVIILWLSGFLDALDGTIARKTKSSSLFGTVMDITFDRIVEISLVIILALKFSRFPIVFVILACSIILSMTIFLTVGATAQKVSEKTFYYQPGLAERTEGFIMFSLMILFTSYIDYIAVVFAGMILFTAAQRFHEAYRHFENK